MLALYATISSSPDYTCVLVNNSIVVNPEPNTRFEGTRLIAAPLTDRLLTFNYCYDWKELKSPKTFQYCI